MTESAQSNDPEVQKRRSTRIAQSVPITVIGVDALGQAFKERTSTVSVNCHGCKYQSRHYIPKNSQITIEIPRPQAELPPRIIEGRVAWVQRPRTVRELFQIGVEFPVPGNVWGIAFPPADWFPLPDDEAVDVPAPSQIAAPAPEAETTPAGAGKSEELAAKPADMRAPAMPAAPGAPATGASSTSPVSTDKKIRVLPSPAQAQETMSMARQMARLLAEAKQHLHRTMQSGAAEAVAQEVRNAREQAEAQLRAAVGEAVEASAAKVAEKSVQAAVEKSMQQFVEKATRQVVQNALAAFEKARVSATPSAEAMDAQVREAVERVVETSAAKLAEQTIQESVQQTVEQAVQDSVRRAVEQATASLPAAQASASVVAPPEESLRQLEEMAQERLAGWRKEIEDAAEQLQAQSRERMYSDSDAATRQWHEQFEAAMAGASAKMGEQLNQISQAAAERAEQEISARGSSLKNLLDEAASEAQKNLDSLCSGIERERARAEEATAKTFEAAQRAEEASAQIEAMAQANYDSARERFDSLLASQTAELDRHAEELIRRKSGELAEPVNQAADEALRRVSAQVEEQIANQLAPQIELARQTGEHLAAASQQAEDTLRQFRERMHEASEQALNASLERMREQTVEFPAEFEQSCRTALARVQEELEAKSTDTTHATFEALYKASDWYQKKAQTSMQSALDKVLDQSTGDMRERAAELSRMFASELDHYSRSYVEHAQGMLEESAREVKQQTRLQMEETAKTIHASLADELQRITSESLLRFEEAAKSSADETQASMRQGAENALGEFNAGIEERMVEGATQARKHLEVQLQPLVDAFYAKRQAEQDAWLEQMKSVVEQSIDQYKERLENTSNSWLLASATSLGQHSKGVLDTLSDAAEARLRDTCADVFAGLGETLRARLMGLSSEVGRQMKEQDKDKK